MLAANQVDIDAGRLAARASQNTEVTSFAERMVTDHTGVNQVARELVTTSGVTPKPSDTSRSLEAAGEKKLARLRTLRAETMQQAYVDAYVHLGQFDGRAQFPTWLTRIAVHASLAHVRRRQRFVSFDAHPPFPGESRAAEAVQEAFSFVGPRCDRVVAGLATIP